LVIRDEGNLVKTYQYPAVVAGNKQEGRRRRKVQIWNTSHVLYVYCCCVLWQRLTGETGTHICMSSSETSYVLRIRRGKFITFASWVYYVMGPRLLLRNGDIYIWQARFLDSYIRLYLRCLLVLENNGRAATLYGTASGVTFVIRGRETYMYMHCRVQTQASPFCSYMLRMHQIRKTTAKIWFCFHLLLLVRSRTYTYYFAWQWFTDLSLLLLASSWSGIIKRYIPECHAYFYMHWFVNLPSLDITSFVLKYFKTPFIQASPPGSDAG
jgi:hypothetical protein